MESDQKEMIQKSIKEYENNRKQEIEAFNEGFATPDVKDPNDHEGINDMLGKVQKMVLDRKEEEKSSSDNFLDKRKKPE